MSMDNTTQVTPSEEAVNETVETAAAEEVVAEEVAVAKTKKELKKERKEIKKHKKQVKKEAKMHSAKTTKLYNFLITVVSLIVIASMIVCMVGAVKVTMNFGSAPAAEQNADNQDANANANTNTNTNTNTGTNTNTNTNTDTNSGADTNADANTDANTNADANADANTDNNAGADTNANAGDASDVTTKAGAVELYKKAHAKVLTEAKSVTRTLDNNINYKEFLNVGGNSALESVAKTLMGMFLKANEEPVVHEGAAIAENFPPTMNSAAGLTADMIGEYSVKEEGEYYIVKLAINSTEENPDLGDNSQHLVNIVSSKAVEDAAAGFVGFTGLKNEYIAPSVEAKIEKASGKMVELHTICPSYMKFDRATVMSIINVDNVGIGLQYETKWTVQW